MFMGRTMVERRCTVWNEWNGLWDEPWNEAVNKQLSYRVYTVAGTRIDVPVRTCSVLVPVDNLDTRMQDDVKHGLIGRSSLAT
jgi:hypothetical protein